MLKYRLLFGRKFIFAFVKKKCVTLLFFTITSVLFSQRKYSKEISFYNDNDLYISLYQDRYYTNGIFLSYRYLSNKKSNAVKKTYEFQIGHQMYTPFKAVVDLKGDHDRPFAAYLFGSFGINRFYKNNSNLKTSIQVGVIGSSALGRELQDYIHEMQGYKQAIGWKYQISDAFALNFNTNYSNYLIANKSKTVDITWVNNFRLGTVFTDLSSGFYTRIWFKPLNNFVNSIAFNSNLNNSNSNYNNNAEVFFFIKPMLHYAIYDATIQGSFLNKTSPITFELEPLRFTTQLGIQFTANRFNFGYFANYHTKKLKNSEVSSSNFYGTIVLNYQFN